MPTETPRDPPRPCAGCRALRQAGWYKRGQVWLLAHGCGRYNRLVDARKRALLGPLGGRVLEIGPGAGANLPYYRRDIAWIGIEPNPYAHALLRSEAARLGLAAEVRDGVAERLALADESVDAVVSTLVLCSVQDPAAALAEVRRVLRPGGRFVLIEHVAAPEGSRLRRVQRAVRPVWRLLGDGCHPDRPTWQAIAAAGFAQVALEHFRVPVPIVGPHIAGFAIR